MQIRARGKFLFSGHVPVLHRLPHQVPHQVPATTPGTPGIEPLSVESNEYFKQLTLFLRNCYSVSTAVLKIIVCWVTMKLLFIDGQRFSTF